MSRGDAWSSSSRAKPRVLAVEVEAVDSPTQQFSLGDATRIEMILGKHKIPISGIAFSG